MKRKNFLRLASAGAIGAATLPNKLLGNAFRIEELESGSEFDVIIIGTGYGASVAALRLAENGIRCLMLEMGMDWDKVNNKFSSVAIPTKESTWLSNTTNFPFLNWAIFEKFTGALDSFVYDNITVYQGRGVGGGSLVNGGMGITPKREEFEAAFPSLDADLFYNNYFPLAHEELKITKTPEEYLESPYFDFTRVFKREIAKAGYSYFRLGTNYDKDYLKQELDGEVEGSVTKLELFFGNNHGKQDLRKTYLQKALDTGNVSILALHKVEQIIEEDNGKFELTVTEINTRGEIQGTKYFTTSKLFLGAGAIGSTELLLKSEYEGTLTKLDDNVGKKWGNNGNINSVRGFIPEPVGAPAATLPTYAVDGWDETMDAFIAELGPFPLYLDARTMAYILINRVKTLATMRYNPVTKRLEIDWDNSNWDHMVANTRRFLDNMAAANGGGGSLTGNDIEKQCWHSLGGCILGEATDGYGRLNGYDNLYVLDSSLIPGQIGVNPFITITALAEYCMETIIQEDFSAPITPVEENTINLIAAPNPFRDTLNLSFYAPENMAVEAQIINWAGRVITDTQFMANEGNNQYTWNGLGFLWRQAYTLRLTVGSQTDSARVIRASWW